MRAREGYWPQGRALNTEITLNGRIRHSFLEGSLQARAYGPGPPSAKGAPPCGEVGLPNHPGYTLPTLGTLSLPEGTRSRALGSTGQSWASEPRTRLAGPLKEALGSLCAPLRTVKRGSREPLCASQNVKKRLSGASLRLSDTKRGSREPFCASRTLKEALGSLFRLSDTRYVHREVCTPYYTPREACTQGGIYRMVYLQTGSKGIYTGWYIPTLGIRRHPREGILDPSLSCHLPERSGAAPG